MGGMSSAAHTGTLLVAALVASLLSWVVFRAVALPPAGRRSRALDGDLDQFLTFWPRLMTIVTTSAAGWIRRSPWWSMAISNARGPAWPTRPPRGCSPPIPMCAMCGDIFR